MFTSFAKKSRVSIKCMTINHRNYMVIKSKAAKRFQNITANKRKRQKQERLKSRYKEYYEELPVPTAFDARNPTQIPLRYLMTQKVKTFIFWKFHRHNYALASQRNPLPKFIIKQIEICTNVRITALFKESPPALLNLPNILQQIKKNTDDDITSLHAKILHQMIMKSFLFTNQKQNEKSEINMFIGSILFEGQRDDIKHALQLYHFIENVCFLFAFSPMPHIQFIYIAPSRMFH